jgi:hypothetical protein
MAENGNQTHPVRTLTVKNFSVIREAKLEFGKITVLIGPQASGKSLLCKLAYFLGGEILGIAIESVLGGNSWPEFLNAAGREFSSRFSTKGWLRTGLLASLSSDRYAVEIRGVGDPLNPEIEFQFSNEFELRYNASLENPSRRPPFPTANRSELRQDLWLEFSMLLNPKRNQASVYIPSERALFTDASSLVSALQSPELDWIVKRFASQVVWDSKWKIGLVSTGRDDLKLIEKDMERISGGVVTIVNGRPHFLSSDGRVLPLALLSSGTLELLPMFSVMNYFAYHQEHFYGQSMRTRIPPIADIVEYSPLFYLEEPESSVFPKTQYELVKLFVWLARDRVFSYDWVITTHSPYVLTSFNNLLEAGQAARNNPKLRDQIAKIVPEQYWIKEGDFKAYAIEDGVLKSILNESGFVEGNYLDQVSETIGDEFDKLLRLEYEHTKAS